MTEIILSVVSIVGPIVSAVLAHVLTKKKYKAEVDSNIIENMQKALDFYKNLSDDTQKRLDIVLQKNNQFESEIADLRKIVLGMVTQICTDVLCQHRKVDQEACKYYEQLRQKASVDVDQNEDGVAGI